MKIKDYGKRALQIEADAILELISRVDKTFEEAVELIYQSQGKVIVTGMGKSGLIGKKIAATLASTGTPGFFLHPAEGIHGDLGMVSRGDILLALSNSGETDELLQILPPIKRLGVLIICFTGNPKSTLARTSDVVLDVSVKEEAEPHGIVPTASTTAALAMGDALAVALFQRRGLKKDDFAYLHPGGVLGRRLLIRVSDVMQSGTSIPMVIEKTAMKDVILEMTSKKLGVTTVRDERGRLKGIITDGDLRRVLQRHDNPLLLKASEVMTPGAKTISSDALAVKAVQVMETHSITSLVVVNDSRRIEGIIHLHDLLKMGVV